MAIIFQNKETKAKLQDAERTKLELEVTKWAAEQTSKSHVSKVAEFEKRIVKYQETQELLARDILSLKETISGYKGNDYQDYAFAVQAISDKYNSLAEWGCLQTGAVIDLRAAFILGDGIKIVPKTDTKDEAKNELVWVKDFLEYNGLDSEMAQELAKEAEIEGKIALRLFWDDEKNVPDFSFRKRLGMVSVRFISWLQKKYTIEADAQDYLWYKRLTWPAGTTKSSNVRSAEGTAGTAVSAPTQYPAAIVEEAEFVYRKFGGRINDANAAQPKVMKCLTEIDRLDKALRDLREINHLFAAPTADFEVETAQQATALLEHLDRINWKIGKAIAHVGTFSLKSPDAAGVENLIAEIELLVKMISGTTSIPIHYLGLLDLLKNRATGDNTRELVMAGTVRERMTWVGVFDELIEKAMKMYGARTGSAQKSTEGGKLDHEKVGVEIPVVSQDQWTNLKDVLIPAALGGIVSNKYVRSQIPNLDEEEEAKQEQEAGDKELERAKLDLERMKQERALGPGAVEKTGEPV
ncbi:MAG: hypothetical protein IMZ46_02310 [Acidobacteria bacterium]|nr:hypothetical protein [Acidobacteriota bacterium]